MAVSVVIPVHNEEAILAGNVARLELFLKKLRLPYELLIIDNGSTDATPRIGRSLQSKTVRFFSIPKRGSVGDAFRLAVKEARHEKIITQDMDLSVSMAFIPHCAKLLERSSMVIGSKMTGSQHRPLLRRAASGTFIALVRVLLGLRYTDYSIGAKGYRKKDILTYLSRTEKGSAYVIELAYFLCSEGKGIAEIPVSCDDQRRSRFNFIDEVAYRFRSLAAFWLRNKLLR
ncbi:MAG: glycosyltransferase family 2 protein [Candidatus Aenigmarchaeota archaeon]|nr:glycosyltransferase family 2 protein [Candidatus Aenigmarchaeota archaeon]